MAGYTTPLGIAAAGAGASLLWSAFTGQSPIAELRKLLQSGRFDGFGPDGGGRPLDVAPVVEGGTVTRQEQVDALDDLPGTSVSIGWPDDPSDRVQIGQGGHTLAPRAATSFRQVEQDFGRTIMVTDSYRPSSQQAADVSRDPSRFGSDSAHVEARAVDVNLGAIGVGNQPSDPRRWRDDPVYDRLADAFARNGWCNYQLKNGTTKGRTSEPWHFAYRVCK